MIDNIDLFDDDGYPTDEALDCIKNWPFANFQDAIDAMEFAGTLWSYPDAWKVEPKWIDPEWPEGAPHRRYIFSTGGWSGNESVVEAIQENQMLQMVGAYSWTRGGLYEYRMPLPEPTP